MAHVGEERALGAIGGFRGISGDPEFAGSLLYLELEAARRKTQTPYTPSVGGEDKTDSTQKGDAPEPPCSPPWRKHGYRRADTGLVPEQIFIGSLHPENILLGRQAGIGRDAPIGAHFVPVLFETLQLIPVAIALGARHS